MPEAHASEKLGFRVVSSVEGKYSTIKILDNNGRYLTVKGTAAKSKISWTYKDCQDYSFWKITLTSDFTIALQSKSTRG